MLVYSRRDLSKIENSIRQIFTHQRTNVPTYIRYFHENVRITQNVAHENVWKKEKWLMKMLTSYSCCAIL